MSDRTETKAEREERLAEEQAERDKAARHKSAADTHAHKGKDSDAKAAQAAAHKAEDDAVAARRKAEDEERAVAHKAAQQAEEEAAVRRTDPDRYYGVHMGADQISYADLPDWKEGKAMPSRERVLLIGGVTYEHISDDADGIWLYRPTK